MPVPTSSTDSFWMQTFPKEGRFPVLERDLRVDVAVIGAGITGLTAGLELVRRGLRVAILEQSMIGAGTSGLNSAHLSTLWDGEYHRVIKKFDSETAQAVAMAMQRGIDHIESNSTLAVDQADFRRLDGYYFAATDKDESEVEKEFEAAREAGLPVTLLESAPLPYSNHKAMRVKNQGAFHPRKYLLGLTQEFLRLGGEIFTESPVMELHTHLIARSRRVECRSLIQATHTPIGIHPLQMAVRPYRSYVTAIQAVKGIEDALFWDTQDPYHYLRPYNGDNKIIIGGKDHETGSGSPDDSFRALRTYAQDHFEVQEIFSEWSAQLYEPADHLPMIGKSPLSENTYIATGYSGDGLVFGSFAGLLLTELITEGDSALAKYFSPSRISWATNLEFVSHNADVARHLIQDRIGLDDWNPDRLQPGEGFVSQGPKGGTAYFRRDDGSLVELSTVCPHMKCILHWNPVEKSFDCPCHGSRFNAEGERIEGPALSAMKPHGFPE